MVVKTFFNLYDWSAQTCDRAEQANSVFNALGVSGKKIVKINAIGYVGQDIDDTIRSIQHAAGVPYDILDDGTSEYSERAMVPCEISLCEPIVLVLEDESTFEIEAVRTGGVRMSV